MEIYIAVILSYSANHLPQRQKCGNLQTYKLRLSAKKYESGYLQNDKSGYMHKDTRLVIYSQSETQTKL